jgi:hypothetical protein
MNPDSAVTVQCFQCGTPLTCEDDDWKTVLAKLDQHFNTDCRRMANQ